jgi:hypothetical protein
MFNAIKYNFSSVIFELIFLKHIRHFILKFNLSIHKITLQNL